MEHTLWGILGAVTGHIGLWFRRRRKGLKAHGKLKLCPPVPDAAIQAQLREKREKEAAVRELLRRAEAREPERFKEAGYTKAGDAHSLRLALEYDLNHGDPIDEADLCRLEALL